MTYKLSEMDKIKLDHEINLALAELMHSEEATDAINSLSPEQYHKVVLLMSLCFQAGIRFWHNIGDKVDKGEL